MAAGSIIFRPIGKLVDRVITVAFAVVFAQGPMYINQYIDVLAGARLEASKTYAEVEEAAEKFNMGVAEFLNRITSNPDPMVAEGGEIQQRAVDRYEAYNQAYLALTGSTIIMRPVHLIRYFDPSIHDAMHFEPGVPMTWEGLVYALVGVIIAILLLESLAAIGRFIMRLGRTKSSTEA